MKQQIVKALTQSRKVSQKWLNKIGIIAVVSVMFTACSKNQDLVTPESLKASTLAEVIDNDGNWHAISGPTGTEGDIKYDGSLYTVKDFRQSYTGAPGQPPAGNFYWSFTENQGTGASSPADIHFSGIATG